MFLYYYANEESDDVWWFHYTVQHSVTDISTNVKALFFKLGTRNVHRRRKNDANCAIAMTTIIPLVQF